MMNSKLLAVDLFSGAGGMSLGFLQTNQVKILAAVENNPYAQKTYKRNHIHVEKVFGDIRNIDFTEITDICKENGQDHVDIVFGGPPCQGFSNANRQKTDLISLNNQLVKEFVKAIETLSPNAFVMENVKAMKSSKHKFFCSTNEVEYLENDLKLKLVPERIILGKNLELNDEFMDFLIIALNNLDLSEYIINDSTLFSKLNHLCRKEKESFKYIAKIKKALKKTFPKWQDMHQSYWSINYQEKWKILGEELQKESESNFENEILFINLKEIIETQKILMRLNELIKNSIEIIEIETNDAYIYIDVLTYGVLDYLKSKFKKMGYNLNEDPLFLNAANFGAPQLRERLFLIGVKAGITGNNIVTLPKPIIKKANEFYTVREAIEDLEELTPLIHMNEEKTLLKPQYKKYNPLMNYLRSSMDTVSNHIITDTRETALERFSKIKQGQNFHHLDSELKQSYSNPGRTQNTVYLRLTYDNPSGTVVNVRKSMWIHPEKVRAISIREAARLQTFPDSFIFEGTKDSQYQQIGNAVPPLLGRAVAEQILKYLGRSIQNSLSDLIKQYEEVEIS